MVRPTRSSSVDIVGVGINATDTILHLPHFPTLDSKVELLSADVRLGGQVASAMVACRRWGLSARYVGKIGDDTAGNLQREAMKREWVEAHWILARGSSSQSAYILVDKQSGERTVLWKRNSSIALHPGEINRQWIRGAKVLLVDGHDTQAAARAAQWAHEDGIPVVGDFDNRYPKVEALLEYVKFPIMSRSFPERLTGETDLLKSLIQIFQKFKCRLTAATLGRLGVLAWDGEQFILCPGFRVKAVDTTGSGDIFHAGFLYGLVRGWEIKETLEFSCAAAALNCQHPGARGGIASLSTIDHLRRHGKRSEHTYAMRTLRNAAARATSLKPGSRGAQ